MEKRILSGNEAVARGVYEAGCHVATAYPGTPSTEILESIGSHYKDQIYCQWACNEKVAFEIASGASIGGARAFAAMKHVGMNVAADPIFTMAYEGVRGGLVFVTADDPGCHSSQNEQDNRWYAPHAKIAMLEPSDSAECRDFTKAAFDLSEEFDTVVMLRMTTRICHSKSIVTLSNRVEHAVIPYERNVQKFAMLPANARVRHAVREQLLQKLETYANDCPFNRVERAASSKVGVITSGVSYPYAREVFGDGVHYLKLGLTYPLPRQMIADFASSVETLYVIEENDPYLETAVRALGFTNCIGKERIPILGELNPEILRKALGLSASEPLSADVAAPPRPPVLCAGCPHRGFFSALSKELTHVVPVGDIGCYTLGAGAPQNALDACICMGAGLSSIIGLSKALQLQGDTRKALGMVGDSTFFHSGITSIIDVISANANVICCVLDNSITAMTGHQDNPGTAKNLMGETKTPIDLVGIILATGLPKERLAVVDPLDMDAVRQAVKNGVAVKGPYVIVTRRPCALIKEVQRQNAGKHCRIDPDRCRGCKQCMTIACPAITFENGKAVIFDTASCNGCGLCKSLCKFDAIERTGN